MQTLRKSHIFMLFWMKTWSILVEKSCFLMHQKTGFTPRLSIRRLIFVDFWPFQNLKIRQLRLWKLSESRMFSCDFEWKLWPSLSRNAVFWCAKKLLSHLDWTSKIGFFWIFDPFKFWKLGNYACANFQKVTHFHVILNENFEHPCREMLFFDASKITFHTYTEHQKLDFCGFLTLSNFEN